MKNKANKFTAYNKARGAVNQGKLEAGRVNRALGIVQTKEKTNKYNTTTSSCECPDRKFRKITCKHMIALMIDTRADQYEDAQVYQVQDFIAEKAVIRTRKTEKQLLAELGY